MERLRQRDLGTFHKYLCGLYAQHDLERFKQHVATSISSLVGSESATYNEVDLKKQKLSSLYDPVPPNVDELIEFFNHYKTKHPLFGIYLQTGDGRAVKISDLLTLREFRRLEVYEAHRQVGAHHAMAIGLQDTPHILIGIALGRSIKDFSERERLLLNLLRPHLRQAYDNAVAVTRMQQELASTRQTIEELDQGVAVLSENGRVQWCTKRAERWTSEYFGPPESADQLPNDLKRWVEHQRLLLSYEGDISLPREPLVMKRAGKRLVVRLVPEDSEDSRHRLLFEEQHMPLSVESLKSVGLTDREAEILAGIAAGKTNKEIATGLHVSDLTIKTHLQNIYKKLGVESRTEALCRVLEILGISG